MEKNHHNGKEKDINNSFSVSGNANGVQIQQNVSNSTQSQVVNEVFEYEKVLEVLNEISNFQQMFKDTYGNESEQVSDSLNQAKQAVINREHPSKIKGFLNVIKEISLRVTSNLVATGILGLLSRIGI
ncbi:hypothetical protein K5X77_08965 [Vagococcus lutrae]|uniref:hypothetical protein n=1 Tax=Vagococcus lutrae TaxID=81947 RepID=UPI001C9582A0|nr:hypothetical protein [Vagococcus lutrae]MDT2806614.1 hypothetical protein [Vagococcus lutrae]MDT2817241.1 hypothetical protein [Vagococcus lutrae]MDT2824037.1 hypothetical protein [Vagococcus lutrae]QZN88563.1 hypothetical protein K5X77_08965 [Vagococcus lutrae]UQF12540.1 hypothetical protein M2919_04265 [Vagococcus lutrae]